MKVKISVIIPTYNSELYIDNLLKTINDWFEEIIICDSFSNDNTLKIASRYQVKIIQNEYINSAKQKNWAIPQAKNDWILIIDSDEIPEKSLLNEISKFLQFVEQDVDMAYIPRKNKFWNTWMKTASAYPDYQSRLFRRNKGKYEDKEVHAQVRVPGKTVYLKNALIHDDFTDISSWWLRNNRYYRYELDELIKRDVKWSFKIQYIKPTYVFFKFYILKRGFKYGFKGFFVSMQWFVYYFFVGAKLYEYELSLKQSLRRKSANSK